MARGHYQWVGGGSGSGNKQGGGASGGKPSGGYGGGGRNGGGKKGEAQGRTAWKQPWVYCPNCGHWDYHKGAARFDWKCKCGAMYPGCTPVGNAEFPKLGGAGAGRGGSGGSGKGGGEKSADSASSTPESSYFPMLETIKALTAALAPIKEQLAWGANASLVPELDRLLGGLADFASPADAGVEAGASEPDTIQALTRLQNANGAAISQRTTDVGSKKAALERAEAAVAQAKEKLASTQCELATLAGESEDLAQRIKAVTAAAATKPGSLDTSLQAARKLEADKEAEAKAAAAAAEKLDVQLRERALQKAALVAKREADDGALLEMRSKRQKIEAEEIAKAEAIKAGSAASETTAKAPEPPVVQLQHKKEGGEDAMDEDPQL